MRALVVILGAVVLLCGSNAVAGTFGGFSADEARYLSGNDQICEPFAGGKTASGFPPCKREAPDVVAGHKFRKGSLQGGATARYEVTVRRGTAICVLDKRSGKKAAGWASLDPISRVVAVRLSKNGKLIAVEYEARIGGRPVTDVVVFAVPVSGTDAVGGPPEEPDVGSAKPDGTGGPVVPAVPDKGADAAREQIDKAWRLAKQRKYSRAAEQFAKALEVDKDNPEARFGLAVTLIKRGKKALAVAELEKLAASAHPDAVVWRVEARFDKAFRKLLSDARFRAAVGLDAPAGKVRSAYERLVGTGGHWEQPGVSCDRARVNLKLRRRPAEFTLRIRTRCQGMDETTKLEGRWAARAGSELDLTFPNPDGPDEVMKCALSVCADGSGEDCLTCAAGTDMEMSFRVVRR